MVHFSIYWVALGRVLTSIISLWINMRPNVKFLQYKVRSQIRDVMPTFMIAILMCAAMCSVNLMQFVNTYVEAHSQVDYWRNRIFWLVLYLQSKDYAICIQNCNEKNN